MNLCYLFLALYWAGLGARSAICAIRGRAATSASTPMKWWEEIPGAAAGLIAIFLLASIGLVDQSQAAPGMSIDDFKWMLVILLVTYASGFIATVIYLITARRLARTRTT